MKSPSGKTAIFGVFVLLTVSALVLRSPATAVPPQGAGPLPGQEVFDLLRKGDAAAVKALVEKTPQLVKARDGQGRTLLHYAAYGRDAGFIDYLVDRGAEPGAATPAGETALMIAAANDRPEAAAALLKRGAPLEAENDYGRTALVLCARERGQAATARLLLDAGAAVDAADKNGSTALELAAWRGKTEFVDLLLERGAKVPESGRNWSGLLEEAVSNGLARLFRRLTAAGQDLRALDPQGSRLLQAAAAGGAVEIVGLLIDKGFSPAKADGFGWTPLHYAARDGRVEAARTLIERGAPVDARTLMGQTPFNVAGERKMETVASLLAGKGADRSATRFPLLEGDYLGQDPPADKPELFAPGIISSVWGLHSTVVFSPDGSEVWWAPMVTYPGEIYSRGGLLMMKRVEGRWTAPAWAPFSGPEGEDDVPFFSGDGNRLYFLSRRPLPDATQGVAEGVWYTDRTATGWSVPQPLDPNVNAVDKHWQFWLDREGDLYFAGRPPDSRGMSDIYVARFAGGVYGKPVNLGDPINTAGIDDTPFVAPDGSYLLFSRQFDLWASFREPDGSWGAPVNLGPEVNSPSIDLCPMVTADGKYLFFLSQRGGESHAYWVSAKVIHDLRARRDEKAVIEKVIRDNIGWALTKDRALLESTMVRDESLFIINPTSEATVGWSGLVKNFDFWMDPRFKATTCEVRDMRIGVSRAGDAAWWSCQLDDLAEWDGKPTGWKDTRWTGVLEKRDGKWLIVQMHFSFAADKVEAQTKAKLEAGKAGPERK